jgi:hypothetical protein
MPYRVFVGMTMLIALSAIATESQMQPDAIRDISEHVMGSLRLPIFISPFVYLSLKPEFSKQTSDFFISLKKQNLP